MQLFEAHCKQSMSKTYLRSANGRAFLACYFADEKDLLPFYPLHSHEELEIVLVESGSADICCNGDCATVHCGDIFIVPPFSSHAIAVHDGDVKLAALVYNFRLAAGNEYVRLGQYAALFNAGRSGVLLHNGCNEKCTKIAIRIAKIMHSPQEFDDKSVVECLRQLFEQYALVPHADNDVSRDKRVNAVQGALRYIATHYAEGFSVADVADYCGYSEFYLMKIFKQFSGLSVVEYANRYRMFVAEKLLVDGSHGIAEVARAVGFDNISYFNRCFKRLYGTTPTEYIEQIAE